ncbi:MAG TPA: hypothetical protein VMV25_10980 [Steroidobacteraceae bacterium]|nr:hypothetical protein [Steroidobacteraceae bacterium]
MSTYRWLIRRELWENRAIWICPAVIGAVLVLAALFGRVDVELPATAPRGPAVGGLLLFALGAVFVVVLSIYCAWYLLDCLHADRKDRSILFWKSLPIGDAATVLAKLATALIVIPVVYFAVADLATLLIAFIISIRASSWFGASLWRADLWLQLQALWLYLIVTAGIWFLPVAAWLMLVSAFAKRAVTLWSILPPLALIWLERMFFGTHEIAKQLSNRLLTGYPRTAFHDIPGPVFTGSHAAPGQGVDSLSVWPLLDPLGFLTNPATWIGAAVAAALIVLAIRLRARSTEL